jgi:ribosomal protein S6
MFKLLSIIVLLCFIFDVLYANIPIDMYNKLQIKEEHIVALEEQILELIKKDTFLSKIQGLKQYHIFSLFLTDNIGKNDFLDYSFLNKLQLSYDTISYRETNVPLIKYLFKIKQKYFISVKTLITDSLGNLVGIVYSHQQYIYTINKFNRADYEETILAQMFFNKEIDFAFRTNKHIFRYFFIKDAEIFIFKRYMTECEEVRLKIESLKDFIECCYDESNWRIR